MGSELELKFSLPASLLARLEREGLPERGDRVVSRYYDTPDAALSRARMAVRVRRHGDRWVQTVKADTGDRFERFEWERPISGPTPERGALPPESTPQGALAHGSFDRWQPLFETDFVRRARRLEPAPGLAIELACDVGEVRCGKLREPIRELELECLEGSRAAFFDWALDWARRERACLTWPTKNERGLRLAGRLPVAPAPVRARTDAAGAGPGASPAEAARAVLRACIGHACANVEPVLASKAPEGPHQLRVALRRLRTALRFFGLRSHGGGTWRSLDRDAATLADTAGRVRDLDVLETDLLAPLRTSCPDDAALAALTRGIDDARDIARADLRRVLAAPATTLLILRAQALAEHLADRRAETADAAGKPDAADAADAADATGKPDAANAVDAADSSDSTHRTDSIHATDMAEFAARRIRALLRRVHRRAAVADDAAGWHRTRIAVKDLRYALEFAGAACRQPAEAARAAGLLARWQDALGAGQDVATARHLAAAALARPEVRPEDAIRAVALIDGWSARAGRESGDRAASGRQALRAANAALRAAGSTREA